MEHRHFGFVSYPFPAFVNPTLPVVSTLVRRGYRVTYATTEGFSSRISALGAEMILHPSPPLRIPPSWEEGGRTGTHELLASMADTIPKISQHFAANRPDILVYHNLAIAGPILTQQLGVPGIRMCSTFAIDKAALHQQANDAHLRESIFDSSRIFDQFLEQHGVKSRDFHFQRKRLNIYFFPKAFQPLAGIFDDDCFFAGRCPGEQPYYGDWCPRNINRKTVVLVSTSTMYIQGEEYFRMCIDAFATLNWHVILSIGTGSDLSSYGALPSNFEIVQNTAHVKILPHVNLFVCLGGIVTTAEAMYHGVPLLVASQGFKELEWQGENIECLGIGLHLKKSETNARNIRKFAVQLLADTALLGRVMQMKRAVRESPGAEETVNRIEEFLETSSVA